MLPDWIQEQVHNGIARTNFLKKIDEKFSGGMPDLWKLNFPDNRLPKWLTDKELDRVPRWLETFVSHADGELVNLWLKKGMLQENSLWLAEMRAKETACVGRVFVLTGNVNDYAFSPEYGYIPILKLLEKAFDAVKGCTVKYSLSSHFSILKSSDNETDIVKDIRKQIVAIDTKTNIWNRVQQDFKCMEEFLWKKYNKGICLIIDHLNMLFPPDSRELERNVLIESLLSWAMASWMFQSQNIVILLTESVEDISADLRSRDSKIEVIEIKRPERQIDRLKFLISLKSSLKIKVENQKELRFQSNFPEIQIENTNKNEDMSLQLTYVAEKTSGLNYLGLEDLLLHAGVHKQLLTPQFIRNNKRDILQRESAGMLEVIEPDKGFESIGGFAEIKERMRDISQAMITSSVSEAIIRVIPMGILFLGPPGTGKTLIAKAFARECKTNFVKLGDFRSMWVGQSERNLTRALALIRSLCPVIVFIDEIDQSEGSRGEAGDSGVGKRVFSKFLQFMSDTSLRGKVLWIAASNRPDLIDAALKRPGRFDMIFPFFPPDEKDLIEIFKIHLENKDIKTEISSEEWDKLAEKTKGFTGAEIEVIVNETIRRALKKHPESLPICISLSNFEETLQNYNSAANRDDYKKMIELTLKEITFTDILPEKYRIKLVE